MVDFGTPSKSSGRQNGITNRPSGAKRFEHFTQGAHFLRSRKMLQHGETPSCLDLRSFFHVLRSLAFPNFSGTVLNKYIFFLVFALASNTSRNT